MGSVAPIVELYGTSHCPYTADLREHLLWNRIVFTEYDVDAEADARLRLLALTGGEPLVPVLVENGRVTGIGWRGRSCRIDTEPAPPAEPRP